VKKSEEMKKRKNEKRKKPDASDSFKEPNKSSALATVY